jgi:DNA-directed RNA polymerase specialized sigma24 family protein
MKEVHADISQQSSNVKDQYREALDLLHDRASLLAGKDKVLMTMYLENGTSFRQLAQLAGVCEVTIARRIRRLTARLTNGGYITCLRNRDRFNETELAIAKDHFLRGLSTRKIAAARHCTLYSVRKTLKRIKVVLKEQT